MTARAKKQTLTLRRLATECDLMTARDKAITDYETALPATKARREAATEIDKILSQQHRRAAIRQKSLVMLQTCDCQHNDLPPRWKKHNSKSNTR